MTTDQETAAEVNQEEKKEWYLTEEKYNELMAGQKATDEKLSMLLDRLPAKTEQPVTVQQETSETATETPKEATQESQTLTIIGTKPETPAQKPSKRDKRRKRLSLKGRK